LPRFLTEEQDITPSTVGSWVDVDLSSYLPEGAVAAIIRFVSTGMGYYAGARKNGSSDSGLAYIAYNGWHFVHCAVDSSRILELHRGNSSHSFYLVGYWESVENPIFFTNPPTIGPSGTGWQDYDITSYLNSGDSAAAAITEIRITSNITRYFGLRENGSSATTYGRCFWETGVAKCDSNDIFEAYYYGGTETNLMKLRGYLKAPFIFPHTFYLNPSWFTLSGSEVYYTLTPSSNAQGYQYSVVPLTAENKAIRRKGSIRDFYYNWDRISWPSIGCNSLGQIEAKASDANNVGFYLVTIYSPYIFTYSAETLVGVNFESLYEVLMGGAEHPYNGDLLIAFDSTSPYNCEISIVRETPLAFNIETMLLAEIFPTVSCVIRFLLEHFRELCFSVEGEFEIATSVDSKLEAEFVESPGVFRSISEIGMELGLDSRVVKLEETIPGGILVFKDTFGRDRLWRTLREN